MQKLCDFSWGRPGAQAIKNAGYSGVIRYLSDDTTGKNLSTSERDSYFAVGLSIRLVWENGAQAALNGYAQGLSDGQAAQRQAVALGLPQGFGIYYAVDFDASATQVSGAVTEYGQGFATGLGGYYKCARYGGYETVNGTGTSWQTCAWSGGQVASNANIYQTGASDFGGAVDVDELRSDDGWDWTAVGSSAPSAATPAPTPNPSASAGPGGTYKVESGDALSSIGAKLGIDWRAIAQLNNISAPYTIYPNEVLRLPGGSAAPSPSTLTTRYTVVSGDNLSSIGARFGVSYKAIAAANSIADPNKISAGQVLVIPSGGNTPTPSKPTYTVVKGDTLTGIQGKTGVNWHTIASLNGINAPYVIVPGEVLKLA